MEVFTHLVDQGTFLAQFTHVHSFHPNEWNFIFLLSRSENMMIFFIFENFSKKLKKNWSFHPLRTMGPFWLISYMCTFFIQMSDFFYFSCPALKIWWFSGVLFVSIHTCAHFVSKWLIFFILVVLEWKYDDFLRFRKLFKKSKKLKFSPTADLLTFLAHSHVHIYHSNEWNFII